MAQMDTADSGGGKKKGGSKTKKLSTRVDLTPMVDLAFLLITFFMLTTTMNKPQAMPIRLPAKPQPDDPPPPEIEAFKVLTLILGANNTIWYYEGLENPEIKNASYSEIRAIILDKKRRVEAGRPNDKTKTVIIIKPTDDAIYKDVVEILDEMSFNEIGTYAMVPVTKTELDLIDKFNNPGGGGN